MCSVSVSSTTIHLVTFGGRGSGRGGGRKLLGSIAELNALHGWVLGGGGDKKLQDLFSDWVVSV